MCDAWELYESYRIGDLVHELGTLFEAGLRVTTPDDQKRIVAERRRVSAKLFNIESRREARKPAHHLTYQ